MGSEINTNAAEQSKGAKTRLKKIVASTTAVLAMGTISAPALAAVPPTYSVISPSEFNLPVPEPGKGIGFFFQNAIYTDDTERYDDDGNKVDNPGADNTVVGISRFGRVFSLEATPNVGYFWEVLIPEVHVDLAGHNDDSVSGIADPLVAFTTFTRPTDNFLIGLENFFTAPIGDNELSFDYYSYQPNVIFDYQSQTGFGIDGLVGFAFKTTNDSNGADPGTDFYVDLRFRYKLNDWITPAVSYDYQRTWGQNGPDAGGNKSVKDSYQHIVGGGAQFTVTDSIYGSLAYRIGVDGQNMTRVNGPYARFVALF